MKSPTLVRSSYKPNFTDPRVKARVEIVLSFCQPLLLVSQPKPIHSAALTAIFGNQKSKLAERLRAKLLIQSGAYKPGTKLCYSYSINRAGFADLAAAIGWTVKSDADLARELYGAIASGKKVIEYSEPTPGARRYHAVQNLPKTLRAELFKGWYDYDIEAAAPTLVYQLAVKVYQRLKPTKTDAPFPMIGSLVEDRTSVRQHIASVTGLDMTTAKSIVVRLFFGARLVAHNKQAIFRLVDSDREVMERLKADLFVRGFRREVAAMWSLVLNDENSRNGMQTFRTGRVIEKAASKGKQRMGVYLRAERQVMDVVEAVLRADGIVPVLIHDGFMVPKQVDRHRIEHEVGTHTGYRIRLAEAKVGEQSQDLKDGLPDDIEEYGDEP